MKLNEKLSSLRKEHKFSQEDLAEKLGVSRQAVSKWELGDSYPEMEKIMQLCKVLKCSLDELVDDEAIGNKVNCFSKFSWKKSIKNIFDFITKTIDMFWAMKFVQKLKCLFEMGLVAFLIFCLAYLSNSFVIWVFERIFRLLPYIVERFLFSIFSTLSTVGFALSGLVIFVHIFKIRYLNYFIEEDVNEKNNLVEQKEFVKGKIENKNNERIIVRDSKNSGFGFFKFLGKLFLFFFKIGLGCFSFFGIISLLFLIFGGVLTFIYSFSNNLFFLGLSLSSVGLVSLNIIVLAIIYNFIFNLKSKFKLDFIIGAISLIFVGLGLGISFHQYSGFTRVDSEQINRISESTVLSGEKYFLLDFLDNGNVEIVIDENKKDIELEIYYDQGRKLKTKTKEFEIVDENNNPVEATFLNYYLSFDNYQKGDDGLEFFNKVIGDLKNKKIRDYISYSPLKIKLATSQNNLNKLKFVADQKEKMEIEKMSFSNYDEAWISLEDRELLQLIPKTAKDILYTKNHDTGRVYGEFQLLQDEIRSFKMAINKEDESSLTFNFEVSDKGLVKFWNVQSLG